MIEAKLQEIRRSLQDLTRNNRLLNHRSKGQRTLSIVQASPAEVYQTLTEDGRTLQFLAREEAPASLRDALPNDPSEKEQPSASNVEVALPLAAIGAEASLAADRRCDHHLQTLLTGEKLQTRLVHLAREANCSIEEQGYNILYCTFGMVTWCDANESSVTSRAPLIFVPVELNRKTINSRFSVQMFDGDVVTNASLAELCQAQFKFDLPVFDVEHADINSYFEKVRAAIEGMKRWQLSAEINIGLYSFTKLQMFRDLDPKNWPDSAKLVGHPLIRSLSGVDEEKDNDHDAIPDPAQLDELIKPVDSFQIVDADSSQQAAVLAAKKGASMVIDGPPGTGKSQTITNIISECLAAGRTILFVSEKAAALKVVKDRLSQAGLGDFALELHSRQASKKIVLEEINRVWEKQATQSRAQLNAAGDLQRVRDVLNSYRRELHEPFGRAQISPFVVMSRAISLSSEPETDADIPDVAAWSEPQISDAIDKLQLLDRRLQRTGDSVKHPWRGVGLLNAGVKEKQQIRRARQQLENSISELLAAVSSLGAAVGYVIPGTCRDIKEHVATIEALVRTPSDLATAANDRRWDSENPDLRHWLNAGKKRQQLKQRWSAIAKPDVDASDWQEVLHRREKHGRSIFRVLRPTWRADESKIRSVTLSGLLPSNADQLTVLTDLVQSASLRKVVEQGASDFGPLLGTRWRGIDSDWDELVLIVDLSVALRQLVSSGRTTADIADKVVTTADRGKIGQALTSATTLLAQLQVNWTNWLAIIASDEKQWLRSEWENISLAAVAERLKELDQHFDLLDDWIELRQSFRTCSHSSLKAFLKWVLSPDGHAARGRIPGTFSRQFYRLLVDAICAERKSLRGFRGQDHEATINQFRTLDKQWLRATRNRLTDLLAKRRPDAHQSAHRQSKVGLLKAEIRKKTRHISLRRLLAEAGDLIQSIKPCFMMSPLSVAQYLVPGGLEFDLVIFDEASQVEPADAYGAIARGKQVILVGDERQLPPTNFFGKVDSEQSDDSDDVAVHSRDLESILSLGIVRFRNRCGLRWHYRSRHSSLIEFSNQKFYDGQLRVFPSPHTDCTEYGLSFCYVEGEVYLRGAGRFNPIEARAVAEAVLKHAIEKPELSLGVGTLNQPQQRAIEDELERLRRTTKDVRIEAFFAKHAAKDSFFVKNIENIQGDERDVIFVSVGFGKDANGKLYLSFGAINGEGGWRRLNVLITRARQRCVVFSSIRHDDINLGQNAIRGVVALKEYLYTAEHGQLKEASVPGGDHDSDFEAEVCRKVRDAGWEVHAQVGCAGFSIDLAVVDPRSPGRYLCGVECDGATYHSSPTARDRDRLRQAVLEDLGWTKHRIWSTDWFRRPSATLAELLNKLKALSECPVGNVVANTARAEIEMSPDVLSLGAVGNSAQSEDDKLDTPGPDPRRLPPGVVPYRHQRNVPKIGTPETILGLPPHDAAKIIQQIVLAEGPIHVDETLRAFVDLFGTRASARPRERMVQAIRYAVLNKWIDQRGEFLWQPGGGEIQVRYRDRDCPVTNAELIPCEEFEAAAKMVVQQQFGLKFDAVIEAVARAFGFHRTGAKLKASVEQALMQLDKRGELQFDAAGFVTGVPAHRQQHSTDRSGPQQNSSVGNN